MLLDDASLSAFTLSTGEDAADDEASGSRFGTTIDCGFTTGAGPLSGGRGSGVGTFSPLVTGGTNIVRRFDDIEFGSTLICPAEFNSICRPPTIVVVSLSSLAAGIGALESASSLVGDDLGCEAPLVYCRAWPVVAIRSFKGSSIERLAPIRTTTSLLRCREQ